MASRRRASKSDDAPAPEVEVVDKPGIGIDAGIVYTTTFLLLLALVALIMTSQKYPPIQ